MTVFDSFEKKFKTAVDDLFFAVQVKDSKLPSAMPVAWLQDVMVVMPADRTHVLVDMQFREKFVLRCPGALGKKYMSHVRSPCPHPTSPLTADQKLISKRFGQFVSRRSHKISLELCTVKFEMFLDLKN